MEDFPGLNPEFVISTEDALRELFSPPHEIAVAKVIGHLDKHARALIARSPFLCIGTQTPQGDADVSPRGDPPGFVKVLNERVLLIPDRPGNNRLDTQSNIIANPNVGIIFMIPGFDETLRINGKAKITTEPALLETMSVQGRTPSVAIAVQVEEVLMHCAKAFRRARLWDPDQLQDRKEMPSLRQIILDQTEAPPVSDAELRKMDEELEKSYQRSMY